MMLKVKVAEIVRVRCDWMGVWGHWGAGNVLFLDLNAGYMVYSILK